ncbi:MAG TPA: hypothetical protein VHE81_07560 [Lacipirellulaceae bacterium]|nr:hypothetical protein [Lacipirellulaceae bacterium]
MLRSKKSANPFYALLVIAGLAFVVTATAYVVMAFREARPDEGRGLAASSSAVSQVEHPLMVWMRHHGDAALLTELGFLAVFTFGAIGTDDFWQRRARASK